MLMTGQAVVRQLLGVPSGRIIELCARVLKVFVSAEICQQQGEDYRLLVTVQILLVHFLGYLGFMGCMMPVLSILTEILTMNKILYYFKIIALNSAPLCSSYSLYFFATCHSLKDLVPRSC